MSEWELLVDSVWKDFEDDYGFKVKSWPGTGHSPVINRSTDYALQDGALFTGQKMGVRAFTLIGAFYGSATLAAFHDQRQALIKALSSRTTKINTKPATVKLKYTGGTVDKEIDVIYEGGLDLAQFTPTFIENDVPVRFSAYNPQFNATSDTVEALDTEDTLSAYSVWGLENSRWQAVGDGSLGGPVYAIVTDSSNGDLYYGGSKLFKWDGSTKTTITTNNIISLAYTPSGDLFVGGFFVSIGGVAANNIAKWDGSTWSALGSGIDASCEGLAYDEVNDLLYAIGNFTTAGGSSINRVAKWDGSTWSALGSGLDSAGQSVALDSEQNLYAGGTFTTAGGVAAAEIAKWDGSTWSALGSGLNNTCFCITTDSDDNVYAGGAFTTAGGGAAIRVAKWDGSTWSALGDGFDNIVRGLEVTAEGVLYAAGAFTLSGSISIEGVSRYDTGDEAWEPIGISLPNTSRAITSYGGIVYATTTFYTDAPVSAGETTVSYSGSEISYPVFDITRAGGTIVQLNSLINTQTNAIIVFDYSLVNGETLTIDFRPGQRSVISSVYGNKWDAILDNSDTAHFFLQPDNTSGTTNNVIALSISETGSPTTTANLTYRTAYRSLD